MKMKFQKLVTLLVVASMATLTLAGCTADTPNRNSQLEQSQAKFDSRTPPKVTGEPEYKNYMRAQEDVYDDPSTILWCTASFPNAASPIFTVPIAGKLTSSSVSYYPGSSPWSGTDSGYVLTENQSVDGMYHGTPPAYRYGFTPGGQYQDFSGAMAVFCTTSLTSFQRESLKIATVDSAAESATDAAEAKLKAGDAAGAQALLDGLAK